MSGERPPDPTHDEQLPKGIGYHRGGRASWTKENPSGRAPAGSNSWGGEAGEDLTVTRKVAIFLAIVAVLTGAWWFWLR